MSKYIDAGKLIAEIERLKEETPIGICEYDKGEENGRMEVLTSLQSTIASLQQEQPEVDLEREIIKYKVPFSDDREYLNEQTLDAIARHFYELGLNAVKEKTNRVDGVVHHALKSHWLVADKNKLDAILKEFPEGAEVELFVCAKRGEKWK